MVPVKKGVDLVKQANYAATLRTFMQAQSASKEWILNAKVAGKTGTPERIWKGEQINDGWYVFFAPTPNGKGNTVVCIRIESTRGSSDAVRLAGKHVIPFLKEKGYINTIK